MRFVVVGAGAIGTAIGGYLAQSGFDVVLVSRASHASAIHEQGLTLKTATGVFQPVVTALATVR